MAKTVSLAFLTAGIILTFLTENIDFYIYSVFTLSFIFAALNLLKIKKIKPEGFIKGNGTRYSSKHYYLKDGIIYRKSDNSIIWVINEGVWNEIRFSRTGR